MSMTKKDYELIAETLRDKRYVARMFGDTEMVVDIAHIAGALAQSFKDDNPKFNRKKFLQACGIK